MEISYDNGNKKFHAGNLVVNPNVGIKITGKCHKPVNGNTKFFPVPLILLLVYLCFCCTLL